MRYPRLQEQQVSRELIDNFRGYNHNLRIGDGEFYDMENLSSDDYPVVSPRKPRGVYARPASPQGLIAKDRLCYVDGSDFVIGEERIPMGLSVLPEDCPKQLISMGAYVIILPDKQYINTMDTDDRGYMEASFTSTGTVTFSQGSLSGESLPDSTYVKVQASGIDEGFEIGDGVVITGCEDERFNGNFPIWDKGEDWILITANVEATITQTAPITVKRKVPDMDFVTESDNRLWGCRYGEGEDGKWLNEIYASKLGDFKNWSCYMGISTDSYTASCGTDGAFTGAVTHGGYPLFFKENCVHKVFGSEPREFAIQAISLRGVEKGSDRSLAIVGETLYYKSRKGIMAYDGSLPSEAGWQFGNDSYTDAVAGTIGTKYYLCMKDSLGQYSLFVLDTAKGLWHREDSLQASFLCGYRGELYAVDAANRNILTLLGSGEPLEERVSWMLETGDLGVSSPEQKYLQSISIRMLLEEGSTAVLYAMYDKSGEWVELCHIFGTSLRSFVVPIRPRRCDHLKLRLEGEGGGKIYSITKTIGKGSWQ